MHGHENFPIGRKGECCRARKSWSWIGQQARAFALVPLLLLPGCPTHQHRDIFEATAAGDIEAMRWFLGQGTRPDLRDPQGVTPLMVAAFIGDAEGTRLLVAAGADVNARARDGRTVLAFAAGPPGSAAVVRLLLESGARADPPAGAPTTPLIEASRHGDAESVQILLEAGANLHARAADGRTALHVAGEKGTRAEAAAIAEILWRAGADPSAESLSGETARQALEERGLAETIRETLAPKADGQER